MFSQLDLHNFFYSHVSIIMIGMSLLIALNTIWKKIFSLVHANCWFCGKDSKIQRKSLKWWFCLKCEQWNGFKEDGDYYQCVPEMYEQITCATKEVNQSKEKNLLCQACTSKQSRKIKELAAFTPKDENHFDVESDDFERFLNEKYKPCLSCLSVISYHLLEQDRQIRKTHFQNCSSSTLRKLNLSNSSSKPAFKYFVKLVLLLTALRLYMVPTFDIVACVLLFSTCFFVYFETLFKPRPFRSCALFCLSGTFLYYYGGLRLITTILILGYIHEVLSTLRQLLRWVFNIKASFNFYQKQKSKVELLRRNHHQSAVLEEKPLVNEDSNRIADLKCQVTPDLLHGHLDAMQIGKKDFALSKGLMNETNHVMAALKYKDSVGFKDVVSSQRPLLRPATFLIHQQKDNNVQDSLEPFTKIKTNILPKVAVSSDTAGAVPQKEISIPRKFNWTFFAVGGLLISFLFNIYLVSKL